MELRIRVLAVLVVMALCGGVVAFAQEAELSEASAGAQDPRPEPVGQEGTEPEAEALEGRQREPTPPSVPPAVPHRSQAQERRFEEDSPVRRYALGIGAGLVDAGPTTEPYFMASLRMRFGDERGAGGGLGGYIEPEVGYWKREALGLSEEDLLIGVNVGGLVMLRAVSYFVAAGVGLHFIERDRLGLDDDATSVGVNIQFGVDVHVSPSVSVLGVGRVDLVEEWDDETQAKIYLGLRFHF